MRDSADSPGDDRVAAAADELYAGAPESFTGRRAELAAAARAAGDRAAAQAIGALRRPTRTAWVVNVLARTSPAAPGELAALGAALRDAQSAKDGRRLRELSAERGELIDALTQRALDAAGVTDAPPPVRLEVSQTLTAALADPGTAAQFAAGTLTRAVQWSGFGVLPADGDTESADADADAEPPARARVSAPRVTPADPAAPKTARGRLKAVPDEPKAVPDEPKAVPDEPKAAATRRQAEAAARRQAAAEERAAREAAERAARQEQERKAAERAVTEAAAAAAEAGAAEDQLEAEVRELETRLTRARSELTAARLKARQAEAGERRARQAADRLTRPSR